MEITISPGVIERDLQKFFLENNVCFESDVIINSVTYGGVVSGGSHVSWYINMPPRCNRL